MNHLSEEQLLDYLDGAMPDNNVRNTEQHLAECAECASALEIFKGIGKQFRIPAEFFALDKTEDAVLDRVTKVQVSPQKKDYFIAKAVTLLAAALLSLTGIALYLSSTVPANSGNLQSFEDWNILLPQGILPVFRIFEKLFSPESEQYLLWFIGACSLLGIEHIWTKAKRLHETREL